MLGRILLVYLTLITMLVGGLGIPLGIELALDPARQLEVHAAEVRQELTLSTAATATADGVGALPSMVRQFAERNEVTAELVTASGATLAAYGPDLGALRTSYAAAVSRAEDGQHVLTGPALLPARTGLLVVGERMINATTPINHVAVIVAFSLDSLHNAVVTRWITLVLCSIIALVIAGAAAVPITRWVIRPINDLNDSILVMVSGEHAARLDEHNGPRELRDLCAKVNRLAATVQATVERQRSFLADASHQLRNPLQLLSIRMENLEPHLLATGSETYRSTLRDIEHMMRTLNQILDISRVIDDNRLPEATLVQSVIASRTAAWLPLARRKEVRIRTVTAQECHALMLPGTLDQVLDILLDNAIKHSPNDATICVSVHATDYDIEVHVVDQGPGMTLDDRLRATGRRWTGTHRDTGGSGLGLCIADMLVGASGGRLELLAAPEGHGLDAAIHLPR
ncbi:MAG TPA: HAMP domain-containing sensor histidine kinase [Actinocrinis sp.]|nr:HAMP domain-containing sensor histidine kinase [Actinocrinis sp.]